MNVCRLALLTTALGMGVGSFAPAKANPIDLTFEGIYPANTVFPATAYPFILDFYNGGTSNFGTSGVDYGISFDGVARAICLDTPGINCATGFSHGGAGDPNSQSTGLFFQNQFRTFLNAASGFTGTISFDYSQSLSNVTPAVLIWSGIGGTGTLIQNDELALTPKGGCSAVYSSAPNCTFDTVSFSFQGVARSIELVGATNNIVFDDIKLDTTAVPVSIPEPASVALIGAGLACLCVIRRHGRR